MMSNNTYSSSSPLNKVEELQKFENSFFPAGGAPRLANIPQAPPAPTNLNNVKSKPIHMKTRNWGPKLENGFAGLNRSLYDRPNVFSWESRPIMNERPHLSNDNASPFPSSTTSTSRSVGDNIPLCPGAPRHLLSKNNALIYGKHLRLRNWGYPTGEGWTGMNRELYNAGMKLERDVLLNELRYKYGPRPNFAQERSIVSETNIVETVPSIITRTTAATTTTALVETGPAKVLATTVPVPMLNPPINDGRRYAKLYKRNTTALASDKGISKLVKRRGTRRDHLVQPNTIAPLSTRVAPYAGPTVIQPATVFPAATTAAYPTTLAPTTGLSKRELRDQRRILKKEQRAARKANRKNRGTIGAPVLPAPLMGTPIATTALPSTMPIAQPATFVGETRSVMTPGASLLAPSPINTAATPVLTPVGVSAQPLDHAHVLAGQLGNAPVKRPRRARKARRGTEQPLYSNIISATPAPVTATTIASAPIATATNYTTSSMVQGTTVVQPATLVSETRNIVVDPLVQQQGMIKQQYNIAPAVSPLAMGNPIM